MEEQFLTCSYSGILEISRVVILTWVDWRFPRSRTLVVWRVIIVNLKAALLALALLRRFIVVMFTIV